MKARTLARSLVMVMAALALLAVLPVSRAALAQPAQTIKLKLADASPPTHYMVVNAFKPWMDRVVQLSKTKVEFDYYPSEQLGKLNDMVNLLQSGVADIAYVPPTSLAGQFPLHTFMTLPGLWENTIEGSKYYRQMLKEGLLLEEFTNKGIRPLIIWQTPACEFFTAKKPIINPEDIKGMKIRTAGGTMDLIAKALNAAPVLITPGDLSTALGRGTVDGTIFPYASVQSYRMEEQVKYGTLGARLSMSVPGYAITEQRWQKLPADVREAMTKATEEIIVSMTTWQETETLKLASAFEKGGMQIHKISGENAVAWSKALEPVTQAWIKQMEGKNLPGQQVADLYKKVTGR